MNTPFDGLHMNQLPDGDRWILLSNWDYFGFEVPAGFVTDLTSSPRLVWAVFPKWGVHGPAAILHDWLYYSGIVDRVQADAIFFDAMGACGVIPWKRRAMFAGVLLGGKKYWDYHRASDAGKDLVLRKNDSFLHRPII